MHIESLIGFKYKVSADLFSLVSRPQAGLLTVQSNSTEIGTDTLNLRKQQVNPVSKRVWSPFKVIPPRWEPTLTLNLRIQQVYTDLGPPTLSGTPWRLMELRGGLHGVPDNVGRRRPRYALRGDHSTMAEEINEVNSSSSCRAS